MALHKLRPVITHAMLSLTCGLHRAPGSSDAISLLGCMCLLAVSLPFGHEDLFELCPLGTEHMINSVGELEMGPAVCKGEDL